MDHDTLTTPERPATEVVAPGPVAVGAIQGRPAQALWARVGLLGIAAAALIAVAILALGFGARPAGTLAAASESDGGSTGVANLNGGGPGFPGGAFDGRGPGMGLGGITITALSGNDISLTTADGWTRTITVDSGTTYSKAGATIALGNLAVGDQIGFHQTRESDGTWTIDEIVVVLPHVGGKVTAVDGSTITVEQRDGTTATIMVTGDTTVTVNGADAAAADVKVGMFLVAEGTSTGDNALTAARLHAGDAGPMGGHWFGMGDGDGPGWGPGRGPGNGPNATAAPQATDSAS